MKFRVWDKYNRYMFYFPSGIDGIVKNENGIVVPFRFFCESNIVQDIDNSLYETDKNRYIYMFATGYKERWEGCKDIYEGDILENSIGQRVCVKWSDLGEFEAITERGAESLSDFFVESKDVRIIGNIWENPDLIIGRGIKWIGTF